MKSPQRLDSEEISAKLERGLKTVQKKESADDIDLAEQNAVLDLAEKEARIKGFNMDIELRKSYASKILNFLFLYSAIVGVLLVFSRLTFIPIEHGGYRVSFELPETVLNFLVGSTATAAIGLVGFVARGLFRPPTNSSS